MSVTAWGDPGSIAGIGLALLSGVSVAAVLVARHRQRALVAIVVGSIVFQLVHFGEHVAQAGYWLGHTNALPYVTPWAAASKAGLAYWCAVWPGKGVAPARGAELLHLIGNLIFFAGAWAAVIVARRVANPQARRAARWFFVVEGLHLLEHVALTATLFATGVPRGLSTGFGIPDPMSTGTISYRLWWHFAVNLIALLLALQAGRHLVSWRPRLRIGARAGGGAAVGNA